MLCIQAWHTRFVRPMFLYTLNPFLRTLFRFFCIASFFLDAFWLGSFGYRALRSVEYIFEYQSEFVSRDLVGIVFAAETRRASAWLPAGGHMLPQMQISPQQMETITPPTIPRTARFWRHGVQLVGGNIAQLLSRLSRRQANKPATEEAVPVGCFGCFGHRRTNIITPPSVETDTSNSSIISFGSSLSNASTTSSSSSIKAAPKKGFKFPSLPSRTSSAASADSIRSFSADSASSAICTSHHALTAAAPPITDTLVAKPHKSSLIPSTAAAAAAEQHPNHCTQTRPVSSAPAGQASEAAVSTHQQPQQQQGRQAHAPEQSTCQGSSSWSFGCHEEQNKRAYMEDRCQAVDLTGHTAFAGAQRAGFFAVYDGHGGDQAAEYLSAYMLSHLLDSVPDALASDPLAVLGAAVHKAEQKLLGKSVRSGTTLCAALLVDDRLHIANVGDSRAVLARGQQPNQLTRDHKPSCSVEAARIMFSDPTADISADGHLYGELGVARDLGSAHIKSNPSNRALIPTPDVATIQLQAEDDFIVLATDGLWDKVENQEAVALTCRTLATSRDATTAARALVDRAMRLESTDNCSVVLLLLHDRPIVLPKSNSRLFRRTVQVSADGSFASSAEGSSSGSGDSSSSSSSGRGNSSSGGGNDDSSPRTSGSNSSSTITRK